MNWLIEQMENPEKRVRLFRICVIISQFMVALGSLIFVLIFRESIINWLN
jgi:hypothetical protein|tara:strand:- start:310 stop:459 length:150 start_codon:yes stop_codon:yes gene_type:complete